MAHSTSWLLGGGAVAVLAGIGIAACRDITRANDDHSPSTREATPQESAVRRNPYQWLGDEHNLAVAAIDGGVRDLRGLPHDAACAGIAARTVAHYRGRSWTRGFGPDDWARLGHLARAGACTPPSMFMHLSGVLFDKPAVRFASLMRDTLPDWAPSQLAQNLQQEVVDISNYANSSAEVDANLVSVYGQVGLLHTAVDSAWVLQPAAILESSAAYWETNPPDGGSGGGGGGPQVKPTMFRLRFGSWRAAIGADVAGCIGGLGVAAKFGWLWTLAGAVNPYMVAAACGLTGTAASIAVKVA